MRYTWFGKIIMFAPSHIIKVFSSSMRYSKNLQWSLSQISLMKAIASLFLFYKFYVILYIPKVLGSPIFLQNYKGVQNFPKLTILGLNQKTHKTPPWQYTNCEPKAKTNWCEINQSNSTKWFNADNQWHVLNDCSSRRPKVYAP